MVGSILLEILPNSLEVIGTIFIAFAALRVHHRVLYEHKIDDKVFREMKREWRVGIFGMFLVISGYLINVFYAFS